jgi:hypothetical protein
MRAAGRVSTKGGDTVRGWGQQRRCKYLENECKQSEGTKKKGTHAAGARTEGLKGNDAGTTQHQSTWKKC